MPFRTRFKSSTGLTFTAMLAAFLFGALPLCTLAATADGGFITLAGKTGDPMDPQNTGTGSCTFSVPEPGRTVDLAIASPSSDCYGIRVETVAMSNLPAGTEVLFTDDQLCGTELGNTYYSRRDPEDNKNFWIKIKTMGPGAKLVEESLAVLTGNNRILVNSNLNERTKNMLLVESKQVGEASRITWNLSCVRVKVSATTSTVRGNTITIPAAEWSEGAQENEIGDFQCPTGTVMTARAHEERERPGLPPVADETGITKYKCGKLPAGVIRNDSSWSISFPECGFRVASDDTPHKDEKTCTDAFQYDTKDQRHIYFSCPVDQVMIGRSHKGDQNQHTKYQCAKLYQGSEPEEANRVIVEPGKWSDEYQESGEDKEGYEYSCPSGQVMVGRSHKGDENGETRYQCATLRAPR